MARCERASGRGVLYVCEVLEVALAELVESVGIAVVHEYELIAVDEREYA
jgi:hypothetical protein